MRPAALIFDFDGVIADSETSSNRALAAFLTAEGLPTSFEESLELYCGRNWLDNQRTIARLMGHDLPPGFAKRMRDYINEMTAAETGPVPGVAAFLSQCAAFPRAIASSSELNWLQFCLTRFELTHHFGDHLYSAAGGRLPGKPDPAIYLAAAAGLGVEPQECWAFEDSPIGASAAVAAGMRVFGVCAGSHIRPDHADLLRAVGVHRIVESFDEVELE